MANFTKKKIKEDANELRGNIRKLGREVKDNYVIPLKKNMKRGAFWRIQYLNFEVLYFGFIKQYLNVILLQVALCVVHDDQMITSGLTQSGFSLEMILSMVSAVVPIWFLCRVVGKGILQGKIPVKLILQMSCFWFLVYVNGTLEAETYTDGLTSELVIKGLGYSAAYLLFKFAIAMFWKQIGRNLTYWGVETTGIPTEESFKKSVKFSESFDGLIQVSEIRRHLKGSVSYQRLVTESQRAYHKEEPVLDQVVIVVALRYSFLTKEISLLRYSSHGVISLNNPIHSDSPVESIVFGKSSSGRVFNPLSEMLAQTEIQLLASEIQADFSNPVLKNPGTLFASLSQASEDQVLASTTHYQIIGSPTLLITVEPKGEAENEKEDQLLNRMAGMISEILQIQKDIH